MTDVANASESLSLPAPSDTGSARALAWVMDINNVNRLLFVLTAIAALYFVVVVLIGAGKLMGVSQHIRKLETSGVQTAALSTSSSTALEIKLADPALGNRNIFQPAGAPSSAAGEGTPPRTTAAYKLVGISEAQYSADTYVMVENTQTKLTYFLQYGQPVEGLELEKIVDDKVIVKIGGNSVELE